MRHSGLVRRRWIVAAAGTGVILAAAMLINGVGSSVHSDGQGLLASNGTPVTETYGIPHGRDGSWAFGVPLCVNGTSTAVTLRHVAPTQAVGSGFSFIGARIRTFTPTQANLPIISAEGFPPPIIPDQLINAEGARVETRCATDRLAEQTELLIGFASSGTDGGGWRGVDVRYAVEGREHVLRLPLTLLICGNSVAADCEM